MKKYKIIYADPPWRYARSKVQGAAEKHYPTMSINRPREKGASKGVAR